jgi:hypothetical protein
MSTIVSVALGIVVIVLMWSLVVGAFYGCAVGMLWLTSRLFPLNRRRD